MNPLKGREMDILAKMQQLRAAGETFVLATIVSAQGSTPRSLGAKMLVLANGETEGTIGGGKLEFLAVEDAKKLLLSRQSALKRYDLIPEGIGMHCGGSVQVFHEVYTPPLQVILLGAGHVAQPLAALVSELGYGLTIIDPRPELVNADIFPQPGIELVCAGYLEGLAQFRFSPETVCFIVSLGEEKEILEFILSKPLRYVGVMGSRRKIITIRQQLLEAGLSAEHWQKIRGPVGFDLGGETPFEVALSMVAELVKEVRGGSGKVLNLGQEEDSSALHPNRK